MKDALFEMWECLIIHVEGFRTKVQIPKEGQPQSCTTELFSVIGESVEHSCALGRFMLTMPNANIVSVQRVQNQLCLAAISFCHLCEAIGGHLDSTDNGHKLG